MADGIKKGNNTGKEGKSIIIILFLIIILGVVAFVVLKLFVLKAPADSAQQTTQSQVAPQSKSPTAEPGPIISYQPFIVNLADPGGNRYLRVTLSIELSKEKDFPAEVTAKEPKIKDIILSILASKKLDDVTTPQGKLALKQEIMRRLNTIMAGGQVTDIFLTEFVVQ